MDEREKYYKRIKNQYGKHLIASKSIVLEDLENKIKLSKKNGK
jgi:hypothetical protein